MAQEMIFKFKPGSRMKGNPQQIGETLEAIRNDNGGLTAQSVIAAAKPKDSLLHRYFDWNDKSAAAKFRENQARHLLASVIVQFRDEHGKTTNPVHCFVALGPKEDRYQSTLVLLANDNDRRRLLAQAIAELESFKRKYEHLSELADLFAAMERVAA